MISNIDSDFINYGYFEYILTGGVYFAVIYSFGIGASYPYFILEKENLEFNKYFQTHKLIVVCVTIGIFFICNSVGFPIRIQYSNLVGGIISLQMISSIEHRSKKEPNKAVWYDGGIYVAFGLLLLFLFIIDNLYINIQRINIALWVHFIAISFLTLIKIRFTSFQNFRWKEYKSILLFGAKICLSSFLVFLLTSNGRLVVEYFYSFAEVGIYSLYYRISSIVLVVHQAATIFFFKNYYLIKLEKIDSIFPVFSIIILIVGFIAYFFAPYILFNHLSSFEETFISQKKLYLYFIFQFPLWTSFSLLEGILYRANLSYKFSTSLIILIILLFSTYAIVYSLDMLALHNIVLINSAAITIGILSQLRLLKSSSEQIDRFPLYYSTLVAIWTFIFIIVLNG